MRHISIIPLFSHMNQPCDQDENIVGRALYELIRICNEIDLNMHDAEKNSPDKIVIKRGRKEIKVML